MGRRRPERLQPESLLTERRRRSRTPERRLTGPKEVKKQEIQALENTGAHIGRRRRSGRRLLPLGMGAALYRGFEGGGGAGLCRAGFYKEEYIFQAGRGASEGG